MKVICVDNFDREFVSDTLVCENTNECYGKMIVELLNQSAGAESPRYYRLVEDDYKLYKFRP